MTTKRKHGEEMDTKLARELAGRIPARSDDKDVIWASLMAKGLLELIAEHGDLPVTYEGELDCCEPSYDAQTGTFEVT